MESKFILVRNFTKDIYEIYWKSIYTKRFQDLKLDYANEHPKQDFTVMGGGMLKLMLDKKTVVLFGNSIVFGQFNCELAYHIAKHKQFQGWTVISNPFETELDSATSGWNNCKLDYQVYQGVYDIAVYSLKLRNGDVIKQAHPVSGKFMVLDSDGTYKVGTFVNPKDIHEIKRISHRKAKV